MRTPILLFLKDSQEVLLLGDIGRLESQVEAIDVLNKEYEAFDSDGYRIDLFVDADGIPRAKFGTDEAGLVRSLILSYYASSNPRFHPEMSLKELVACLCALYRYGAESSQ